VLGRIQSLARAHALLANARWEGVELSQLMAEEMAPFDDGQTGRIALSGAALMLWPAAAQSLALVIHELATNAAKYGALSTTDGRVEIKWEVAFDPHMLVLDWIEHSSVAIAEPTSIGFGSRIISASVERQLQGRVTKQWRPEGLLCRLEFPLRAAAPSADG
jgi:two-component sensor histidine kinase